MCYFKDGDTGKESNHVKCRKQVFTVLDAASVGFFTGNNRGWHLDAHRIKVVHFRFSSAKTQFAQ